MAKNAMTTGAGTGIGSSPRRAVRLVVVGLLLVPLAACATKRDVRDMQAEQVELHSQQQTLLREIRDELASMRDSVSVVSRSVQDNRAETLRRMTSLEDLLLRVQELAGLSQQQLAGLRDEIERTRAQQTPFGPPSFDPTGGADDDGATELYEVAVTQFQRGNYSSARMGFREIVDRFGGHALAPEARYYLADILVQQDDPEAAIEAFLQIPELHPEAPRVPDALYRVGELHLELGNRTEAETHLERVVNTWPDSGAADLARDTLRDLE